MHSFEKTILYISYFTIMCNIIMLLCWHVNHQTWDKEPKATGIKKADVNLQQVAATGTVEWLASGH